MEWGKVWCILARISRPLLPIRMSWEWVVPVIIPNHLSTTGIFPSSRLCASRQNRRHMSELLNRGPVDEACSWIWGVRNHLISKYFSTSTVLQSPTLHIQCTSTHPYLTTQPATADEYWKVTIQDFIKYWSTGREVLVRHWRWQNCHLHQVHGHTSRHNLNAERLLTSLR